MSCLLVNAEPPVYRNTFNFPKELHWQSFNPLPINHSMFQLGCRIIATGEVIRIFSSATGRMLFQESLFVAFLHLDHYVHRSSGVWPTNFDLHGGLLFSKATVFRTGSPVKL